MADSTRFDQVVPLTTADVHGLAINRLLAVATTHLRWSSSTPRLDAELLLAYALDWPRSRVLAEYAEIPDPAHIQHFRDLVNRRAAQEPVAYLIGRREFYGFDVYVDPRVLIPRPETELLVELTIAVAVESNIDGTTTPLRIVDVGTGSGAIAVALAMHLPHAHIYATDISAEALEVATVNVEQHKVTGQVTLWLGDLLTPLSESVHLIVSNPPYTILTDIDTDVLLYQPHLALDGGSDGLTVYRRLLQQAPGYIQPGSAILLEIGALQSTAITELIQMVFPQAHIMVYQDLAGYDRVVVARI